MRGKALDVAAELGSARVRGQRSEIREAQALLEWMEDNHFTFLGYREYRLRRGPRRDRLVPVPRSGLGIMRPKAARKPKTIVLTGDVRAFARSAEPLIITKANSIATVHRSTYLDYIGVKTYDAAGNVTGERRFIGLWTSSAYSRSPGEIPVLRHKIQRVVGHFGLKPSSHDHKALVHALETFPRDELFQATVPDLVRIVRGIVNLYERAQVRLFVRRDVFRRFYSCLVYVPRDRYNTQARERIEKLALEAFGGLAIESQVSLSESVLARLHMLVRTPPESNAGVDAVELERRITETVRTWQDQLKDSLLDDRGEAEALRLFRAWGGSFPAAYQEDTPLEVAVDDVAALERLVAEPAGLHMALYRRKEQPPHKLQFKLLSSLRPIPISDVLPTIENLGLKLISERPYEIDGKTGVVWIQDFELEHPRRVRIDLESDGPRLMATFAKVWTGQADNDGFNRLVLAADLSWREAVVLRTYARWFGQLGLLLSQAYIEEALASNAAAAGHLVRLFVSRFDPALSATERRRAESAHRRALERLLAGVTRIDDDRILRAYLAAIDATLRTNYFRTDAGGEHRPFLALKLDPRRLAEVPLPKPMFEIFVHSPRVEGVHLRMGRVARGGLRWSDRRDDFRTEVLGLMKAQNVKNTVIVPVGAKGGFVPRRPPAGRDEALADGTECYRWFIRALLDVTDNVQGGKVRPPAGSRQARRRRCLPRRRRRQGHCEVLGRCECNFRGIRILAWRRLRLRRLGRVRPQGHGDHRPRRLGIGPPPFPRARQGHAVAGLHRRGHRRHVGRRVRQRDAAVAAHPPGRGIRPSPHLHRSVAGCGAELRRAQADVRPAALELGRLRQAAALEGRRRAFAAEQDDRPFARGESPCSASTRRRRRRSK